MSIFPHMDPKNLPLPDLNDMRRMLRLACRLHHLPPTKRGLAMLDDLASLIHADWGAAWVGEREPVSRWCAVPTPLVIELDADPAVALLARSQRKRTPVVRFRDELVARTLWQASADPRIRSASDAMYSLHRESDVFSIVAFYRSSDRQPWTERERGILQLLHAQCARCVTVDLP